MRIVLVLALVGCASDQIGGPTQSIAQLAEHLDSLAVAAEATGDSVQARLLSALETPLAFGSPYAVVPVFVDTSEIQDTFDVNTLLWYSVAYALVDTATADTTWILAVAEDQSGNTVLYAERHHRSTSAALISGDSTYFAPQPSAVHITAAGIGSPCAIDIPVRNPAVASLRTAKCVGLAINTSDTLITVSPVPGYISGLWLTRPGIPGIELLR
jgi:hypothetical protein